VSLKLFALTLALAHPSAHRGAHGDAVPRVVAQRLQLVLRANEVTVTYTAEVPQARVYADARERGEPVDARWLGELRGNLRARWNGVALELVEEAAPDAFREGDDGFFEFELRYRAPLPGEGGTLALSNGNFPYETSYFATEVRVSGDLVVTESTLVKFRDGRLREDGHDVWLKDESAREPSVTVRPAAFWERVSESRPLPERMVGTIPLPWWMYLAMVPALVGLAFLGRALGSRVHR